MKEIKLKHGKVAFVDDEDFERLNKYSWREIFDGWNWYAVRNSTINKKAKTFLMHREVMNCQDPKIYIDHIDHDGLNNIKSNLRECSPSQNKMNVIGRGSSEFLGVNWHKTQKGWQARIQVNKKQIYLGVFKTENEAAIAYDNAAKTHFGEFANLNFKNNENTTLNS